METYLPDKPVTIEVIEEEPVPYTVIRYFTGFITLLVILLSLWITLLITTISFNFAKASIGYIFIPVMILFVFRDPVFRILIIFELVIFLISIALTILNTKNGILGDFKKESGEMFTFSELFTLGMALSIIIVLLMGGSEGGGSWDLYHLHMVVLDAPFYEELTFRFIWLIIPSVILSYHFSKKALIPSGEETSDSVLRNLIKFTVKGKGTLDSYDYILITLSALFFGLSHFIIVTLDISTFTIQVEFSWGAWKIIQASLIGVILGYLALRAGLPFSLAFHWLVNALSTSAFFALQTNNLLLVGLITVLYFTVIIGGIVVMALAIVRLVQS